MNLRVYQLSEILADEIWIIVNNKIKNNAQKEHRSLSQQTIVTLKKGLGIDENYKERRRILVDQIMSRRIAFDTDKLEDPVNLIRDDRD